MNKKNGNKKRPRNKPTLLIIDDEVGIRESLRLILENEYDLVFATNGPEGLEALAKNKEIALVLTDIKMPRINGIEVTKEIKRRFPDKKVIVVTGYASSEVAQEAANAGADDYIVKPFESKTILKKTAALL